MKKASRRVTRAKRSFLTDSCGVTLIEILIALFLVTAIFGLVAGNYSTGRRELEEALEKTERALRFSTDEASLRNSVVRLHFLLNEEPQQYSVEHGPEGSFILPSISFSPLDNLSLEEQELARERNRQVDRQFKKIPSFQDQSKDFSYSENVRLLGVGSILRDYLITEGKTSIYFYPTGERDGAIIIFATEDEVVSLSIDPFLPNFNRVYQTIKSESLDLSLDELEEKQMDVAQEMFEKWRKD